MSTSIRLVRCPRCRKILPELPNIAVYKCGGCGTTLRAKKDKNYLNGNGSRAQSRHRYEPSIVSSSSGREGDHPFVESSAGSEAGRQPFESRTHISKKRVDASLSNGHSQSTRPNYQQNVFSPEPNKSAVPGEHGRLLENYAEPRRIESLDPSSEKSLDGTSAKTMFFSFDSFVEYEDSSEGIVISRKKDNEGKLNVITSVNKIENSHDVLADDPETTHSSESELKFVVMKEPQNNGNGIGKYTNDIEDSQGELSLEGNHSTEPQISDKAATHSSVDEPLKLDDENEPSSDDDEKSKVDTSPINPRVPVAPLSPHEIYLEESPELGPSFHRISSEELLDTSPINPRVPIAPVSPDDIYMEESPEVGPNFHLTSFEEMFDTIPLNPRVSVRPFSPGGKYLEESPEVGPNFQRVSSEEMLDTLPLNPRVSIRSFSPDDKYLEGSPEVGPYFHRVSSEEMLDTLPINPRAPVGSVTKSPTRAYYASDESEYLYDGSAQVSHPYRRKVKGTGTTNTNRSRQKIGLNVKNKQSEQDWRRHESPEPRKHIDPIRTSMTAANNDPISRGAYMPRRSQPLYGNGSPASSTQNVFMHSGESRRPDTIIGSDPEKVELLRMVRELEDKINRTQMSKPVSGERFPSKDVQKEIRSGGYYDDLPTGRNPHLDFKYSGHQRSHPKGVAFVNHPTSSEQVFRVGYDNTYPSHSPSPQHYSSSQFSHEIPAGHQKNNHEILHLREKRQVMKRHLRPASGGAPIINCYICSELLQLPADFLLFKKRCHQLRCSSCNTILKFSILKKSRLVPYVIKIQAPLPSEMDNYNNVGSTALASTSHANNSQDAGPVSFSDDDGSNESGRSLPSSSHFINQKKTLTVMEVYGMINSPRDNIEATGPSSSTARRGKPSSEIEKLPATSGSPLHRLMGYESARNVLFAKYKDESNSGMGHYMDRQVR